MHTLHWWAVEAEDKEDAANIVEAALSENNYVEWSDWHVVGGGRWSDSQYENSYDMVISYADEPVKFNEIIYSCVQARIDEMKYAKEKIDIEAFTNRIETYVNKGSIGKDRFGLKDYYIRKATTLMLEYYNPDSYFYDFIEHTASTDYIYDRVDKGDCSRLFLVPVDFHY